MSNLEKHWEDEEFLLEVLEGKRDPTSLTPLDADALEDLEARVRAEIADPTALSTSVVTGSNVLTPSGDSTGAKDIAAINAALAATDPISTHRTVYLRGAFTIKESIALPSHATLVLLDAEITLAAKSNCPLVTNSHMDVTGNEDIHIECMGGSSFNGAASSQERQTYLWHNAGIFFCNVKNFSLDGVTIGPTNYSCVMTQLASDGQITNTKFNQDESTENQGGFEFGPGSKNISIDGVRGTLYDDLLDVAAFKLSPEGYPQYVHAYTQTVSAAERNSSFISLRNVNIDGRIMLRLLAGDKSNVSYVTAQNLTNRHTSALSPVIAFGPTRYVTESPSAGDIADIEVEGLNIAASQALVSFDSHAYSVKISDVRMTHWTKGLITNLSLSEGFNPTLEKIGITNIQLNGEAGDISVLNSACSVTDLTIKDIGATSCEAILKNGCNVSGLSVSDIRIGELKANPFQSTGTETGELSAIYWRKTGGTYAAVFPSRASLKVLGGLPALTSADTPPSALYGAKITCDYSLDPNGAGGTTGGEYVGNGEQWKRTVDLGGFNPGMLGESLLAHFDASQIVGVTNEGKVSSVLDLSGNGHTLSQGTAEKQPLWIEKVTELNNHAALRFDGSNDTLVSSAMTEQQTVMGFVVCSWRVVPTNGTVFDGTLATASRPLLYVVSKKPTIYAGSANLVGPAEAVKETAYLYGFTTKTGEDYLRVNSKAPVKGGTAGDGKLNGITLASAKAGTELWSNIDIAEVVLFNALITEAHLETLQNYLATKYGITLA